MTVDRALLYDQLRLQDQLLTRRAEESLRAFVAQAWPILEPATPFLPNWHLDLMAEYLEAVSAGEITRLVINVPPRYGKSTLVSVLWPAWEWIRAPHTRWLFASYSDSLATKHSLDRRAVIQSAWYATRWGDRVRLTSDQNEKTEYRNDRRGAMTATSVGGSATGKGGNRIVIDDPHNPMQADSDAQRHQAIAFYQSTLATRLDDKRRGAIVLVMQRLHTHDLTAVCLDHGFTLLRLPAEAETRTTLTFPRSDRQITREVGDVLWPAREGAAELATQRLALGSYAFAGQYQQRPSPRGGGLFKRDWWQFYDELPSDVETHAQSWDLAFKDGDTNDYVVGLVGARRGADIYLLDRFKAHASFQESLRAIRAMTQRYPRASTILIEDKANGPAIVDTLRQQIGGIIAVAPQGGKYARASACEPRVEAGNVYRPRPTRPNGTRIPGRAWVEDFIEQLAIFPKGGHDDDVDAFTQLVLRWQIAEMPRALRLRALRAGASDTPPPPRIF